MCFPPFTQHCSSFTLSMDSSSDDQCAYIPSKNTQNMLNTATVKLTSGKTPILTSRDMTPSVMMEFENTCLDFFEAKSVPNDKQVAFILLGIRDLCIQNWIAADWATIMALPFATFMTQLCTNYLHLDWEDHVHNEILNSCLDPNKESFWAWSQNIIKLNCLLWNTTSIFDDATLHNQLNAHLDNGLKECVKYSKQRKRRLWKPGLMQSADLMRLISVRTNATGNSLRRCSTSARWNVIPTMPCVTLLITTMWMPPLLLLPTLLPIQPLLPYSFC